MGCMDVQLHANPVKVLLRTQALAGASGFDGVDGSLNVSCGVTSLHRYADSLSQRWWGKAGPAVIAAGEEGVAAKRWAGSASSWTVVRS